MSTQDEKAEQARAKLAQDTATLQAKQRENWPAILDLLAHQARERHTRYQAHVKAGFTEVQALYLCTVA
jgi:hypothetical protein